MLVRPTEQLSSLTGEMKSRPEEQWGELYEENSCYLGTECYENGGVGKSCTEEAGG